MFLMKILWLIIVDSSSVNKWLSEIADRNFMLEGDVHFQACNDRKSQLSQHATADHRRNMQYA